MINNEENSQTISDPATSPELFALYMDAYSASEEGQMLEDVQMLVSAMQERMDDSHIQLSGDIIDTLRKIKKGELDLESAQSAMAEIAMLIASRDGFADSKENFLQSK